MTPSFCVCVSCGVTHSPLPRLHRVVLGAANIPKAIPLLVVQTAKPTRRGHHTQHTSLSLSLSLSHQNKKKGKMANIEEEDEKKSFSQQTTWQKVPFKFPIPEKERRYYISIKNPQLFSVNNKLLILGGYGFEECFIGEIVLKKEEEKKEEKKKKRASFSDRMREILTGVEKTNEMMNWQQFTELPFEIYSEDGAFHSSPCKKDSLPSMIFPEACTLLFSLVYSNRMCHMKRS